LQWQAGYVRIRPTEEIDSMRRVLTALLPVFALAFVTVAAAQKPGGNPEARKMKNPQPMSQASIDTGRGRYKAQCIFCHGPGGKGDGAQAKNLKTKPEDLTDDKWANGGTDGELFFIIRNGLGPDFEMKPSKMKDDDIWHVINFIRSLGPPAKK
jgi:mono/diheme cytochrome c family protein